ncbi:diacylglycerol/lipid kinase family protein [Pollutibacter soli]|uniref:diacylglycerol/lipid kinase family protein n=1 Tax=Pollutibacter soli TaxID=3034157 RepID=UPI0030141D05
MDQFSKNTRLLFVVNPASGSNNTDWQKIISDFFSETSHTIEFLVLSEFSKPENIKNKINSFQPERVIAVGGDGTIKMVAESLLHTDILLGIIPAGSANGMARELLIPKDIQESIQATLSENTKTIHVISINNQICIHLSDVGFNAFIVKKFERENVRGKWGYLRAAWKVFWKHPTMDVSIHVNDKVVERKAAMIVLANATKYGSGAVINPAGQLDDDLFELIILKKLSIREIFKMMVSHQPYDRSKTELVQCNSIYIRSEKKLHLQIDGQYIGKVNHLQADLIPGALKMIIP